MPVESHARGPLTTRFALAGRGVPMAQGREGERGRGGILTLAGTSGSVPLPGDLGAETGGGAAPGRGS